MTTQTTAITETEEVVVAAKRKRVSKPKTVRKDFIGETYGQVVIIEEDHEAEAAHVASGKRRARFAIISCDCGNTKTVMYQSLRAGNTKSCGCANGQGAVRHGGRSRKAENAEHTQFYWAWKDMHRRCEDPNNSRFDRYGGRGITVCEEWSEYNAFVQWAMFESNLCEYGGVLEKGLTIERIDNDGNYEPSNCRFATRKEQANNKSNNLYVTYEGRTQTFSQWCDETGMDYGCAKGRYYSGYDLTIVFDPTIDLTKLKRSELRKLKTREPKVFRQSAGA